jgi:calcineurin-like phosphoesterase
MNILFIGDIFASAGRRIVADHFQDIVGTNRIDLAVANAEDTEGSQPGQLSIYGNMGKNHFCF